MSLPYPAAPAQSESRSVLAIPAFRKLWRAMAFSSFGDWLGLLASTALAQQLAGGDYAKANFAIAGVFIVRLLPAVILGPFAGVIADRFDRRKLMVVCDILRFFLYLSIPIVGNYFWLYTASILAEVVTLFWSPAKEASVPNLVPKLKLESANQVSLLAAYGTAPIAAIVFSLLALFTGAINSVIGNTTPASAADLALYVNATSFAFCAYTVWRLKEIPAGATAVGVPARILHPDLPKDASDASKASFSAYGITPNADDPVSLALKSLIDATIEQENKIKALEEAIAKLGGQASDDVGHQETKRELDAIKQLLKE